MTNPSDRGRVRISVLTAGRWVRDDVLEVFAQLRAVGCSVSYADVEKRFWDTSWYNVSVSGERQYLESFQEWVEALTED